MDFRSTTVAELTAQVSAREVAARELVGTALDRIERLDGDLGAFVAVDGEAALADAAAIDERIAAGEDVGPLAGIPLAVKDLDHAAGFPTTYGSAAFAGDPGADADSPFVERLRAAGCVVVGKTNTAELGWKADTVNVTFGATRNPWDLERSAGGSSGGSPAWPLLSTKGPMARCIRDVALALDTVVGPDPTDLASLPLPEASWSRSLLELNAPRKVAWSPTLGYAAVDSELLAICESAVARLESLGSEIVVVDRIFDADPVSDWLTLVGVSCLRTLEPFRESDGGWSQIDPGLVALMEWVRSSVDGVRLMQAIDTCHTANLALVDLFHDMPLLMTPTVAGQLPCIGEPGMINGEPDVNWVRLTYPFNMTRSPAGTVCAGFTSDGLPVGLQVIGPQHADVAVLRLLALLEDVLALDPVPAFPSR